MIWIVLVLLLVPGTAEAQSPRAVSVVLGTALAAHVADLVTTEHCLTAGRCQEGNPVLRPFAGTRPAFRATKLGLAGGLFLVKWHAREDHPRLIFWFSVAETALLTTVAVRNARLTVR